MTTDDQQTPSRHDPGLSVVIRERRHLTNLAYRLLGSVSEAEDVVQETYARWYAMPPHQRDAIRAPGGWLTTVAGRVCLDLLGSARARRERYIGEWIPEPLPEASEWTRIGEGAGGTTGDPADRITLDESVTMAFMVTLESMTPAERVALILHDVFGYSFAEVAGIVGRTPAACRQLAFSARRHAREFVPPRAPKTQQASVIRAFKKAWAAQDLEALVSLLDPDATAIADGGGLTAAAVSPIEGAARIADHYAMIAGGIPHDMVVLECVVNGQPGLAMQLNGVAITVMAFEIAGDKIKRIWAVRNPEKLRHWASPTGGSTRRDSNR